ncbi:YhcN/YlaJ family sporulation lipoprotein [Effusibacillus pohliae]|uniref:YhcN/YlaJ family sporulation lipoprotein n=1 Tax=Effusibacillus pohliae TaxID=232270 RepID=UPI000377FAAB|nr:YhcN/YlaJ family sporulation lipoprotein [Effusibacillus pohliae]
MRPRTYILALVVSLSVGAMLAACQKGQNANPDTSDIRQAHPPEMISQGIKADYRIAEELNKIPGVQGAAVLIHNGEAYVGAHVIGDEKQPDAYMKKPFGTYYPNGEQPFAKGGERSSLSGKGVPKTNAHGVPDTSQNGVTQSGQNVNEIPNRPGGTAPAQEKAGSATGNVEPELVRQIEAKVKAMAPNVTRVYFTAKREDVGQLQGYARYIQDGGSMERFAQAFDDTIKRIWPTAKP